MSLERCRQQCVLVTRQGAAMVCSHGTWLGFSLGLLAQDLCRTGAGHGLGCDGWMSPGIEVGNHVLPDPLDAWPTFHLPSV